MRLCSSEQSKHTEGPEIIPAYPRTSTANKRADNQRDDQPTGQRAQRHPASGVDDEAEVRGACTKRAEGSRTCDSFFDKPYISPLPWNYSRQREKEAKCLFRDRGIRRDWAGSFYLYLSRPHPHFDRYLYIDTSTRLLSPLRDGPSPVVLRLSLREPRVRSLAGHSIWRWPCSKSRRRRVLTLDVAARVPPGAGRGDGGCLLRGR
jgi:hypothetical protein